MKSFCNIHYGENQAQCLDIHLPECETFSAFLYFHGGGLESGDKTCSPEMLNDLTSHGIAVISANYRMYPAARYPEFIEDAAAVTAWVVKNIGHYGEMKGLYIGGSSAGAYLSMMLCFDRRWLGKHGISPQQISGYIHDAGQPTVHFHVLRERGVDTRRVIVDDAAPLFHVGTDTYYPPMLVIVSDHDMENRYEQTMLLISTLRHFDHSEPEVTLKIMNGKHCAYCGQIDQNGHSVFGQIVCRYITGERNGAED